MWCSQAYIRHLLCIAPYCCPPFPPECLAAVHFKTTHIPFHTPQQLSLTNQRSSGRHYIMHVLHIWCHLQVCHSCRLGFCQGVNMEHRATVSAGKAHCDPVSDTVFSRAGLLLQAAFESCEDCGCSSGDECSTRPFSCSAHFLLHFDVCILFRALWKLCFPFDEESVIFPPWMTLYMQCCLMACHDTGRFNKMLFYDRKVNAVFNPINMFVNLWIYWMAIWLQFIKTSGFLWSLWGCPLCWRPLQRLNTSC